MTKLDELLGEIYIRENEYEMLEEIPVTDEELNAIKERVIYEVKREVNRCTEESNQEIKQLSEEENLETKQLDKEYVQDVRQRIKEENEKDTKQENEEQMNHTIPIASKKRKKKRWILPLVATLAIGGSLVADMSNGSEVFKVIFGEHVEHIGESGVTLDVSDTQNNITLTAQGIVGGQKNAILLFDLEKPEGEQFEGNNISFGKLSFEIKEKETWKDKIPFFKEQKSKKGGSFGWRTVDREDEEANQRMMELDISLNQDLIGEEAVLTIEDVIESQSDYWPSEINLANYLEQHPECLNQKPVQMEENFLDYISEEELILEGHTEQEAKAIIEDKPTGGISNRNLGLVLYPEFNKEWKVDNIGFVDEKLHNRMSGVVKRDYRPSFKDASGNEIEMIYNMTTYTTNEQGEDLTEGYYVYDIKNLEELKQAQLSTYFSKEIKVHEGTWQVQFKVDIKNNEKEIKTNHKIPWLKGSSLTIEEMKLSNISLKITYSGEELRNYPKATVKFKDGQEIELRYGGIYYGEKQMDCHYTFEAPIDVTQVEVIIINEVEIKVE